MKYCNQSGKEMFATQGAALKAARRMERQFKGSPSVYLCPECCRWHLTHYSYRDCHNFARQTHKRKKKKPMKIICDTEKNNEALIIEVDRREDEPDKVKVTTFSAGDELVTFLSYDQALELVEALKIQIAKL